MPTSQKRSEDLTALALSLRRQGDFAAARQAAMDAVEACDDNASAWFNLAAACAGLGEHAESEAAYHKALELRPDYAEAWSNLAGLLGALGRHAEAIPAYRRAIAANDRLAPIWSNLGNALCDLGQYAESEQASRRALRLDSGFVPAWINLGRALHASKRFPEARSACQRAVDLAPGLPDAWTGLGHARIGLQEFDGAVDAFGNAARLRPDDANCHANLAVALRRAGAVDAAFASVRRALALDTGHAAASWQLADWLLQRGEFAEGWQHYESRWRRPDSPPRRYPPRGGTFEHGRALLWGEQGVGDEILYSVMAAELARRGIEVTLEADARLAPLFQRSFPQLTVLARRDPPHIDPGKFDHVVPLGSLARLLRGSREAFPPHRGYLEADPERAAAYRRLVLRNRLLVGLAWRSSNPQLGASKSAPLAEWGPLLGVPGITFVNLQHGAVDAECEEAERRFGVAIARVPRLDLRHDLDGLAALQAACDLVITTSNVNAHVTGALGKPGWVLLPERIGRLWYWCLAAESTPWYPSLALISQRRDGDWASAMELAAERLRRMLAGEP